MSSALTTGSPTLYVGIDIAAATATVATLVPGERVSRAFTIAQSAHGYTTLQQRLLSLGHPPETMLIVMEATGPYWINLATTLVTAGFRVSVINPYKAHHFAKSLLKRAKTDVVDAQTLARLAAALQPAVLTPPPAIYHELQQRLIQRDALLMMRQQARNQVHALLHEPVVVSAVRARLERLIATLDDELTALDAEFATVLCQDEAWAQVAARLETIPGVGRVTAAWLLVATLHFTICPTPKALTAYAGLAPTPHQSGTSVHGPDTMSRLGHARLRTAFYMASLSAAQHNPAVKPLYDRLRARGKPSKVARCAAARKLLHIAWAVATKGQPFDPHYHNGTWHRKELGQRVKPWRGRQHSVGENSAPPSTYQALRDDHALGGCAVPRASGPTGGHSVAASAA